MPYTINPNNVSKCYGPNKSQGCIFTASGQVVCGFVDGAAAILNKNASNNNNNSKANSTSYGNCATGCTTCAKR